MKKKLTLSIDEEIIKNAKAYAKGTDRSLSELIENYLERVTNSNLVEETAREYKSKYNRSRTMDKEPSIYRKMASKIETDWDPVEDREKFREVRLEKYT
jgi:hypothetical protein